MKALVIGVSLALSPATVMAQDVSPAAHLSVVELDPLDVSSLKHRQMFLNHRVWAVTRGSAEESEDSANKLKQLFTLDGKAKAIGDMADKLAPETLSKLNPTAIIVLDGANPNASMVAAVLSKKEKDNNGYIPRDPIIWGGGTPLPLPVPGADGQQIEIGQLVFSKEQSDLLSGVTPRAFYTSVPLFAVSQGP